MVETGWARLESLARGAMSENKACREGGNENEILRWYLCSNLSPRFLLSFMITACMPSINT